MYGHWCGDAIIVKKMIKRNKTRRCRESYQKKFHETHKLCTMTASMDAWNNVGQDVPLLGCFLMMHGCMPNGFLSTQKWQLVVEPQEDNLVDELKHVSLLNTSTDFFKLVKIGRSRKKGVKKLHILRREIDTVSLFNSRDVIVATEVEDCCSYFVGRCVGIIKGIKCRQEWVQVLTRSQCLVKVEGIVREMLEFLVYVDFCDWEHFNFILWQEVVRRFLKN